MRGRLTGKVGKKYFGRKERQVLASSKDARNGLGMLFESSIVSKYEGNTRLCAKSEDIPLRER